MKLTIFLFLIWSMFSHGALAVDLVSDETIKKQKELTKITKLKNGIPVIHRRVPGSDIVHLDISWSYGVKDLVAGKKSLNQWLWSVLPMASKNFPKSTVNEATEKYGLELACHGGIEVSSCSLSTLNDFLDQSLPMFADLINQPALHDEDVALSKDRVIATLKNSESDPNSLINEIVNSVYYPKSHPYRLSNREAIAELSKLNKTDLISIHQQHLNANLMSIVVVSSLAEEQLISKLEQSFGFIPASEVKLTQAKDPEFVETKAYAFHDRDVPTAYLRIKFPVPAMTDKDAIATKLLFEILSEELGEEIRTKRSLSYAVHAFPIQYSRGIGIISVSTAKPKDTIEALQAVLDQIKSKTFSKEELDEYKHVFATNYYLTQETHDSLASALATCHQYFDDANVLYELPRKLDVVTPQDIQRLAHQVLGNFRVGVIYSKKSFENQWIERFIKRNRLPAPQKTH